MTTEMTPSEIESAIREKLEGPVHEYAVGFSRTDWNDIIVEVQRGNATIEQAVDTIKTWFVDYPPEPETETRECQCEQCGHIEPYEDYDVRPNGTGSGLICHAQCCQCGGDAWQLNADGSCK